MAIVSKTTIKILLCAYLCPYESSSRHEQCLLIKLQMKLGITYMLLYWSFKLLDNISVSIQYRYHKPSKG